VTAPVDRQAFRAWVRAHHPDVGGDPREFAAGLQQWQTRAGEGGAAVQVAGFRSHHGLWPLARWWQRRRRDRRVL
jgi:hypothetical protein